MLHVVAKANGAPHVSFDVDFLDPIFAPKVSTAVSEGATNQEARLIMEMLSASQLVNSFDIVEFNPPSTPADRARMLLCILLRGHGLPLVKIFQAAKCILIDH